MGLASLHLYLYTQGANEKFELVDLKLQSQALRSENRQLNKLVSQEERPAEIEAVAKRKLNMAWPKEVRYLFVSEEAAAKTPLANPTID